MVELNENRNSLQLDRPDAVRKLYFTLEIINKTTYICFTELLFLRCKKIPKKAVEIGGFLQCSVYISRT